MSHYGAHLKGFADLAEVISRAQALGGDAVQVFLSPPLGNRPAGGRYRAYMELGRGYRAAFERAGVHLYVHAPYTLNLARADARPAEAALQRELEMAASVGARGVVLHVGKHLHLPPAEGAENMAAAIGRVLDHAPPGPLLLLETAAGQGTELFADPLDLGRFARRLLQRHPGRLALCLDTCHAFASGATLGPELMDALHALAPIALLHVNGSLRPHGCWVDRHAPLLQGSELPEAELRGAVAWARRHHVDCVLETPSGSEVWPQEVAWMRRA